MSIPSPAELAYWNAPDELLGALYRVSREPVPELRETITSLLDHADPDVREEALRILASRWKDQAARPKALEALECDPAPRVRSAAAYAIASLSTSVTRTEDTQLLIRGLRDKSQPMDVRRAAYNSLIILHRKGEGGWGFPSYKSEFDPVRNVDWGWVSSLETSRDE
jgi:hypothetical protein